MSKQDLQRRTKQGSMDYILLGTVLLLLIIGLLMLFESSSYMGQVLHDDGYYYLKQQLVGVVLGGMAMVAFIWIDYRRWRNKTLLIFLYLFCVFLLVLCFVPGIGIQLNDARRWISIGGGVNANGELSGRTIQPSEFVKYIMIVVVAGLVSYYSNGRIYQFGRGILFPLFLTGIIDILLYNQPNYSMVLLITASVLSIIIAAGAKRKHILIVLIVSAIIAGIALFSRTYRANRVDIFLNPFTSTNSGANQVRQAYYAIASGGVFGQGLGNSRQKLLFLPQRESDFIMSIYAEEFGLVGCIVLMALFGFVIWRGYRIASRCKDVFGTLIAVGITTVFGLQVILNMGVGLVALPTTGVTLPFFSFGSSSLVCVLASMGLLLGVSRNIYS